MLSSKVKVLVFMLSRRGCIPYAKGMIDFLEGVDTKIYVSRFASEQLPEKHIKITTYTNKFNFLWNSLIVLPSLFRKTLRNKQGGYGIAYFPVFHHWNIFIILFCKLLGIKSIITIHDGILHEGENHWLHRWMQDWTIQLADHIVFLTEYVRDSVKERLPSDLATSVIPHGPIGYDFVQKHSAELSLPARLLFFGRIVEYKGLDILLSAMPFLPKHLVNNLTIAGMLVNYEFPDALDNRVNLQVGRQSEQQINQLLQSHDLLVLPYRSATQSGIIPLGLSANIPMVITDVGGLKEQVGEDEAVWVSPNPSDIANGIIQILENPLQWKRIKEKVRIKTDVVSWEDCGKMLKGVIESVANIDSQ
jgi:glycosyltransferase involved in cell wall biosynthesis